MDDPKSSDALRIQLRRAREAAGLSRAELARRLGISDVQVGRIETGSRGTTIELAHRWLTACGFAVESVSVGEPEAAALVAEAIATLDEADLQAVGRVIRAWKMLPDSIRGAILQLIAPHEPH